MAKTKTKLKDAVSPTTTTPHAPQIGQQNGTAMESPEDLYSSAVEHAQQSQPDIAIQIADKLWSIVKSRQPIEQLPALTLRGEILLELGGPVQARECFEAAVKLDPDGTIEGVTGAGAEKFMWLAQLSEEGGKDSLAWFEKGIAVLDRQVRELESGQDFGLDADTLLILRAEKKARLASALCGVVELFMTDLSWEDDAEERCEQLITRAITVEDETSPEVLQTLASIRLSQDRHDDARAALDRSYGSWKDLDVDDPSVPDFAARISLARLLMEAEMKSEALEVVERLTSEDDESVEAWYLGGWCQHLIAEEIESQRRDGVLPEEPSKALDLALKRSRRWLTQAVKLYTQLDYEDDRLRDHAVEILQQLDQLLGPAAAEDGADDDDDTDDEWQGIDSDEDHQMQDA